MSNPTEPRVSKWPFFLGDGVLLVFAWFVYAQARLPLGPWETGFILLSCTVAAAFGTAPFVLEYRALVALGEAGALVSAADQLRHVESFTTQIAAATAQWQGVQEASAKTMETARDIAGKIGAEAAAFSDFLQKANESEKANLRLEVEKLRRAEGEWLQVIVRMLDHTFALHQAALRSGQPGLIEQLGQFQNACRDAARRVGLLPLVPAPGDPFNPQQHQQAEGAEAPTPDARVAETIATGFSFQGRLVRQALVRLQSESDARGPEPEPESAPASPPEQPEEESLI